MGAEKIVDIIETVFHIINSSKLTSTTFHETNWANIAFFLTLTRHKCAHLKNFTQHNFTKINITKFCYNSQLDSLRGVE